MRQFVLFLMLVSAALNAAPYVSQRATHELPPVHVALSDSLPHETEPGTTVRIRALALSLLEGVRPMLMGETLEPPEGGYLAESLHLDADSLSRSTLQLQHIRLQV